MAATTPRKKEPPKAVSGLGEEAFWAGDRVTGALYVLQGDTFLRISLGGSRDEAARLERTSVLAKSALRRLAGRP